jgi:hypothetical protein
VSRFRSRLVHGEKSPYDTWTFVVLPPEVVDALGISARVPVRGTLAGTGFRGTVSKGEGVYRMSVPRALLDEASVQAGDLVEVALERDPEPRPVDVPTELQALFDDDPELGELFAGLPPSQRRAWAAYVGEAKRPETRARRARKAPDAIRARQFPS